MRNGQDVIYTVCSRKKLRMMKFAVSKVIAVMVKWKDSRNVILAMLPVHAVTWRRTGNNALGYAIAVQMVKSFSVWKYAMREWTSQFGMQIGEKWQYRMDIWDIMEAVSVRQFIMKWTSCTVVAIHSFCNIHLTWNAVEVIKMQISMFWMTGSRSVDTFWPLFVSKFVWTTSK